MRWKWLEHVPVLLLLSVPPMEEKMCLNLHLSLRREPKKTVTQAASVLVFAVAVDTVPSAPQTDASDPTTTNATPPHAGRSQGVCFNPPN